MKYVLLSRFISGRSQPPSVKKQVFLVMIDAQVTFKPTSVAGVLFHDERIPGLDFLFDLKVGGQELFTRCHRKQELTGRWPGIGLGGSILQVKARDGPTSKDIGTDSQFFQSKGNDLRRMKLVQSRPGIGAL